MSYDAFISYSHSDCGNITSAIQRAVENIGKPWYKLGRNLTIYRDETNLAASPNLWVDIEIALSKSSNFILLASPKASESFWVNKEILYWLQNHYSTEKGLSNIYIIKIKGDLSWNNDDDDWDWKEATCLPTVLKNKFNGVPIWIDLSEFISQNNLPINYKSSIFTASLVKIVAGILNKTPREVDSDELRRKRNTIFALILSLIAFIILISLGYIFYTQKEINKRNAVANNLIAEGNKYSETDINKALLMYAYAYSTNKDTSTFNIFNDFYKKECFSIDTAHLRDGSGSNIVDTINFVFQKIKPHEKQYMTKDIKQYLYTYCHENLNWDYNRKKVHLYLPLNSYYIIETDAIVFFDLITNKKILSQQIDLKNVTSYYTEPNSDLILLLYDYEIPSIDSTIKKYTISKRTIESVMVNHKLLYDSSDLSSKSISYKIYDFNKLAILVGQKDDTYSSKMRLILSEENKTTSHFINLSQNYHSSWNEDILFCFSNVNSNTIFMSTISEKGNQFYLYDLAANKEKQAFNNNNEKQANGYSADIVMDMHFTENNEYLIWGNRSGEINQAFNMDIIPVGGFDLNREKYSNLSKVLTIRDRYIMTSNDDGIICIYENTNYICLHSTDNNGVEIRFLKRIQLPTNSNISTLYYYSENNSVYIINNAGEIYLLKLNYIFTLKKTHKINDMISGLKLNDILSKNF